MKYTENYSEEINRIKIALDSADAVLIGAGAGLSSSAGLKYSDDRFLQYFSDFHKKYGINDIYTGGFYPFETLEEYWAWWSRQVYYNRYNVKLGKLYTDLLMIVKDKDYFVLTTNVDHQFQMAGFDKNRLFYTQGDYGLFQCSQPCHNKTYDNKDMIQRMVAEQKDMKIPTELIPRCSKCGKPMTMNLRIDNRFVQDGGWDVACKRYEAFVQKHKNDKILLLELGVGSNTPSIIKYPFWQMTMKNKNATYACINLGEAVCPTVIEKQSICINEDIGNVISQIVGITKTL